MIRKHHLYTGAQLGWGLLVGATFVLLYSGQAESFVPVTQLPRPLWVAGLVASGVAVAGWVAIAYHQNRAWRAMGRQVGLTPDESSTGPFSPLAKPDLTGTIQGRPVRVCTASRTVVDPDSGGGSSSVTSTVVRAELDSAPDDGVVIGRTESGESPPDRTDLGRMWLPNEPVDDGFVAVGGSSDLARNVLSPTVRESLLAPDTVETLLVGNAVESVTDHVEAMAEERSWGNLDVDAYEDVFHHNPATVANQFQGTLLDADQLERHLEAVVAVADSFEAVGTETVAGPSAEGGRR